MNEWYDGDFFLLVFWGFLFQKYYDFWDKTTSLYKKKVSFNINYSCFVFLIKLFHTWKYSSNITELFVIRLTHRTTPTSRLEYTINYNTLPLLWHNVFDKWASLSLLPSYLKTRQSHQTNLINTMQFKLVGKVMPQQYYREKSKHLKLAQQARKHQRKSL